MREVGKNKHQALWLEAIDAKFEGIGEAWGREEFDKILASFEVRPRFVACASENAVAAAKGNVRPLRTILQIGRAHV